jgi:hypothetical protein
LIPEEEEEDEDIGDEFKETNTIGLKEKKLEGRRTSLGKLEFF